MEKMSVWTGDQFSNGVGEDEHLNWGPGFSKE